MICLAIALFRVALTQHDSSWMAPRGAVQSAGYKKGQLFVYKMRIALPRKLITGVASHGRNLPLVLTISYISDWFLTPSAAHLYPGKSASHAWFKFCLWDLLYASIEPPHSILKNIILLTSSLSMTLTVYLISSIISTITVLNLYAASMKLKMVLCVRETDFLNML